MDATGDHPEKRWVGVGGRGVVMRWKEGEDLQAKAFVMVSPEGTPPYLVKLLKKHSG